MNISIALSEMLPLLIHIVIFFFFIINLIRSFSISKRQEDKFKITHVTTEFLLMMLISCCFALYDMSSFEDEKYFLEFSIITGITILAYWIGKFSKGLNRKWRLALLSLTAALFWLSVFTFIKFLPYLPWAWFPFLGLLALAPLFLLIMTLSEINFRCRTDFKIPVYQGILLGLIPIIIVQLVMNTYTPYSWEFVALFNPENTSVF